MSLLSLLQGKYLPACQQPKKSGIARVTFDLYKLSPKDFIGCLNVKATMYEMYSVSYDIRCTGLKAVLRYQATWGGLGGEEGPTSGVRNRCRGRHRWLVPSWRLCAQGPGDRFSGRPWGHLS